MKNVIVSGLIVENPDVSPMIAVPYDVREGEQVNIYVYMRGQRCGPYDKPQLETMWHCGQIPSDTLYWHDGMRRWHVISDLFADPSAPSAAALTELERIKCNPSSFATGS